MRRSDKDWRKAVVLCHLLGGFGAHRFYVGKFGTGLLYLILFGLPCVSLYIFGGRLIAGWASFALIGVAILMDLIMLYTGNFTDADGDLLVPPSRQMLLAAIRQPSQRPVDVPTAAAPAKPAEKGVIRMTRILAEDAASIQGASDYIALGLITDQPSGTQLCALRVHNGKIVERFTYDPAKPDAMALFRFIRKDATLVGYDLRARLSDLGAIFGDVEASADWYYIDLRELAEARSSKYVSLHTATDEAENAVAQFEKMK